VLNFEVCDYNSVLFLKMCRHKNNHMSWSAQHS